jgi:hypothetical protein
MLHKKEHYKKLSYDGFSWYGFFDGLHHFSRKESKGYTEITCTEEMLTNGDIEFMVKHGLTFNPKSKALLS